MAFDIQGFQKSTRKVGRFLQKNSKRPSAKAIHNLRTRTRSLETTFITLSLDKKSKIRRLLRDLANVRKRAGKIRDMDVLTGDILTLNQDGEQDCRVQLIEHLGAKRKKYTRTLHRELKTSRPRLRPALKLASRRVKNMLQQAENNPPESKALPATITRTVELATDLRNPARLTRNNLHPYRLKVKELRNVLQLSGQVDTELLDRLGEVKNAIGEWHDWEELIAVATKLLDHGASCELIKHMKATSDTKYERALSLSNRLRKDVIVNLPRREVSIAKGASIETLPLSQRGGGSSL